MSDNIAHIGVITVSDRASRGQYEDISGPAIEATLNDYLTSSWKPVYRVIEDEQSLIEQTIKELVDKEGCCLVVTTVVLARLNAMSLPRQLKRFATA